MTNLSSLSHTQIVCVPDFLGQFLSHLVTASEFKRKWEGELHSQTWENPRETHSRVCEIHSLILSFFFFYRNIHSFEKENSFHACHWVLTKDNPGIYPRLNLFFRVDVVPEELSTLFSDSAEFSTA